MERLTEEVRLVGGDRVYELFDLVRTHPGTQHEITVFPDIGKPSRARTAPQASFEHGLFAGFEIDPGFGIDQRGQCLELPCADAIDFGHGIEGGMGHVVHGATTRQKINGAGTIMPRVRSGRLRHPRCRRSGRARSQQPAVAGASQS